MLLTASSKCSQVCVRHPLSNFSFIRPVSTISSPPHVFLCSRTRFPRHRLLRLNLLLSFSSRCHLATSSFFPLSTMRLTHTESELALWGDDAEDAALVAALPEEVAAGYMTCNYPHLSSRRVVDRLHNFLVRSARRHSGYGGTGCS